jgi:hypothetical protein
MEPMRTLPPEVARQRAERAARALAEDPRVRLVFFFGSAADPERTLPVRDVDLAVLTHEPLDFDGLLDLHDKAGRARGAAYSDGQPREPGSDAGAVGPRAEAEPLGARGRPGLAPEAPQPLRSFRRGFWASGADSEAPAAILSFRMALEVQPAGQPEGVAIPPY